MRWAIAAVALVAMANSVVLVSAGRERAAPVTETVVDVCASQLIGGGDSDDAPSLQLPLAPDSLSNPSGLDQAGLRALGFAEGVVAALGRERDSTFRFPRARPAWVRLRQRTDSLGEWTVAEVVPLSDRLAPDSVSIVIRGLVSIRERWDPPPAVPVAGHDHGAPTADHTLGVLQAAVTEVIPHQLHLDHHQIATLRAALPDTSMGAVKRPAVIANGVSGGIWVQSVR